VSALDDLINGSGYGGTTSNEREAARAELAALRRERDALRVLLEHAHYCIRDADCKVCAEVKAALRGEGKT